MKLVIVESPAKAKTIGKFLGKDYRVTASFGHIRDLPSSADEIPASVKSKPWARLGVDVENDFAPVYVVQSNSKKRIAELRKLLKEAESVILATDEDREGESISWHLLETLKPKVPVERIVFHEITREAIDAAIAAPRGVDEQLVRAQESRRILDRLYGYSLSPVLWRKVRSRLSAGRVQSVAVRLVVEREEQRRAFHRAEYWKVDAALKAEDLPFNATLVSVDGRNLAAGKDFDAGTGRLKAGSEAYWLDGEAGRRITRELEQGLPWEVVNVESKDTRQRPQAPFITSTLQQAANGLLGFSASHTMRVAQRLYEGVGLGGGEREGLITYMRTDSVVLSDHALDESEKYIRETFGDAYHEGPRRYTTKSKLAQEAHEAIRPTSFFRTAEDLAPFLGPDELKLYRLIWNRAVASQMPDARLKKSTVDFAAHTGEGRAVLRANGSVVTFPGFLRVADSRQEDTVLPDLRVGMRIISPEKAAAQTAPAILLESLTPTKHETQHPARYTEATLVRRLEEDGVGRPATYASIISIIQNRGYVEKRGNALVPTFVGIAVTQLLREHFAEYVDPRFTARMEEALDGIARGEQEWIQFLRAFYRGQGDFGPGLETSIEAELPKIEYPAIPVGNDPESGAPIVVRIGRAFPFLQRGEGGEGNTATVPADITFEELTVEKALELIASDVKGNEALGEDPETGEKVYCFLGPYGPYVQLGEKTKENKKPKRASLPKGTALSDVTLKMALDYLSLPRTLGEHPETGKEIKTAIGRFGPYVVCDGDFRSLDKTDSVFTIDLKRALELLAQPKGRRGSTKKVLRSLGKEAGTEAEIQLYDGRYGPYVSNGSVNASLPKSADPDTFTLEQALELLANAPKAKKKRPARKKAAAKKTAARKKAVTRKKPATD